MKGDARARAGRFAEELRAHGTAARAEGAAAYLKSARRFYGVDVPTTRRAVRALVREIDDDADALWALVDALWGTDVHELLLAAALLLEARADELRATDAARIVELVRQARTWALVDVLAPTALGSVVRRFPRVDARLTTWARDEDFWVRRAALLSLLLPMRRGEDVFARFDALATPLLGDREFFIRKAIGWLLRERGKKRPAEVAAYVRAHEHEMAGLTRREAAKGLRVGAAKKPVEPAPRRA